MANGSTERSPLLQGQSQDEDSRQVFIRLSFTIEPEALSVRLPLRIYRWSNSANRMKKIQGIGLGGENTPMWPLFLSWHVRCPNQSDAFWCIAKNRTVISPLASSMFTPGIQQISNDLNVGPNFVIGATTCFVLTLGFGPLILAPLSETFGRRKLYLVCFSLFSLLQIPTALSPNVGTLITLRTFSGFFGSQYHLDLWERSMLTD